MSQNTGNYLSIMGQSLKHNRIKTRELGNSIIGKNWSIMWQGLVPLYQYNGVAAGMTKETSLHGYNCMVCKINT